MYEESFVKQLVDKPTNEPEKLCELSTVYLKKNYEENQW